LLKNKAIEPCLLVMTSIHTTQRGHLRKLHTEIILEDVVTANLVILLSICNFGNP
jgi:hypothetical protein